MMRKTRDDWCTIVNTNKFIWFSIWFHFRNRCWVRNSWLTASWWASHQCRSCVYVCVDWSVCYYRRLFISFNSPLTLKSILAFQLCHCLQKVVYVSQMRRTQAHNAESYTWMRLYVKCFSTIPILITEFPFCFAYRAHRHTKTSNIQYDR